MKFAEEMPLFHDNFELKGYGFLALSDEDGLLELQLNSDKSRFDRSNLFLKPNKFKDLKSQLALYLEGELQQFEIKINFEKLTGSPFQKDVWTELLQIPYGDTISYKELATKINKPNACRAVGSANGKNPIPILIPCHRVIAHTGSLGGYSLGLELKRKLLQIESMENRFL
jgi:methylated-DNA-[protein]-cysteine S-methyltransferase